MDSGIESQVSSTCCSSACSTVSSHPSSPGSSSGCASPPSSSASITTKPDSTINNNNSVSSNNRKSLITDKKCLVCGDKASAYNFGGLSCETCKIFFRRNAFHIETLRCNKTGKCPIDIGNRKACSKCRLEKCFSIGMKKELLYSRKSQRDPENELSKKNSDKKSEIIHEQRYFSSDRKLLAPELELLTELTSAMSIFSNENVQEPIGEVNSAFDAFNLQGLYIKKIIKFCKALPCFRKLKQLDQMAILKPFHTEITCIRHAFYYKPDVDGFYTIANESGDKVLFVPSHAFQSANLDLVVYCRNFLRFFHAALEGDPALLSLVTGHMLFKPREDVTCLEYLSNQYLIYCRLIRRYLDHKHAGTARQEDIEQKYGAIMLLLKELSFIRHTQTQVLLRSSERNKIFEVMIELYNIQDGIAPCPLKTQIGDSQ